MLYEIIFVGLFLAGWLVCAFIPWLVVSAITRGNAGIGMLPLCLFAGVVGALAVPFLINDGWTGVWLSFVAAVVAPAGLMAVRRLTADAALTPQPPLPTSRERGSVDPAPAKPVEGRE